MADHPASDNSLWGVVNFSMGLTGKTGGRRVPPPGTPTITLSVGILVPDLLGGDDYTYVDEGGAPVGTADHPAVRDDRTAMTGDYWFETVHLLPRAAVDFGNIVTTVDERFEMFSAFRHDDVTLLGVVNNALPGTELPDLPTPPTTLTHLNSFLDPLSTNLNPLAQVVRALSQGLPNFDTTIDFSVGSGVGTLYLGVKGNRIALLTADFDGGLTEILESVTDILPLKDGKEQRIAVRKNPRQLFEADLHLVEVQRQIVQALLFGWQGMTVALPIWPDEMRVTADVTGGTTDTVSVDSTDYIDIRIGGLAVIFKDDTHFDVLTVQSITATSITFDQTITSSFDIGDRVAPVRLTVIDGDVQGRRYPVNLEQMRVRFTTIENDIGAPTGDTSAFSSYDGKVLLDDFNFLRGTMSETFEQKVSLVDNLAGILSQSTPWAKHKRSHVKGFVVKTREDLWNVRRLLYALNGRQVSFWIPTFIEDLTVTQSLSNGDDKMTISNIGYTRFIQNQEPKATFRITFTDSTSLVREVSSSEQLSATEERLTLASSWPADRTVSEIQRVQFYELVRLDTDEPRIRHSNTVGRAKISLPVKVVFD